MKIFKLFSHLALPFLFSVISISCSNENEVKPNNNQTEVGKVFPVEGTYFFEHTGANIVNVFDGEVYTLKYGSEISLQGTLLVVYKNAGGIYKIITKTADGGYYTIYMQNITDESVSVYSKEYTSETEAIDAEYPAADESFDHTTMQGWITYTRDRLNLSNLSGSYKSELDQRGMVFFQFDVDSAFVSDMGSHGASKLILEKKSTDYATGQLVYEITKGEGSYYSDGKHKGRFLTIYVKDIAEDGASLEFAIATKPKEDGSDNNSISNSNAESALPATPEEAQAIEMPADGKVWEQSMSAYANLWIPMARVETTE